MKKILSILAAAILITSTGFAQNDDCSEAITVFPYFEDFNGDIPCWQFISANQENMDGNGLSGYGIDDSQCISMGSFYTADDYNQFLITPEISLPSDGHQYAVYFWYTAFDEADAFRVRISTTTSDTAAFTTVIADNPSVSDAPGWTEVAYILPPNTKYIAINYYGEDAFFLSVDNFSIELFSAPHITLSGPDRVGTGIESLFTVESILADSISWIVDGTPQPANSTQLRYTFTTVGDHSVVATATNSMGSSSDSLIVDVFSCDDITIPYIPDFSEGLGCWISYDDNIENEDEGWMASIDAFEDEPLGQILSFSAYYLLGMMLDIDVDCWAISPLIGMPENGSYKVSWKVMAYDPSYPNDHYGVYVICPNGDSLLLFEETLNASMNAFTQRNALIPSSVNGDFRIAFRHWNSTDGYVIILDDIKVVEASSEGIEEADGNTVSIYPNPAKGELYVDGDGIVNVELLDINGRKMMTCCHNGKLDISSLANGMYMVRVTTDKGVSTTKVVKK